MPLWDASYGVPADDIFGSAAEVESSMGLIHYPPWPEVAPPGLQPANALWPDRYPRLVRADFDRPPRPLSPSVTRRRDFPATVLSQLAHLVDNGSGEPKPLADINDAHAWAARLALSNGPTPALLSEALDLAARYGYPTEPRRSSWVDWWAAGARVTAHVLALRELTGAEEAEGPGAPAAVEGLAELLERWAGLHHAAIEADMRQRRDARRSNPESPLTPIPVIRNGRTEANLPPPGVYAAPLVAYVEQHPLYAALIVEWQWLQDLTRRHTSPADFRAAVQDGLYGAFNAAHELGRATIRPTRDGLALDCGAWTYALLALAVAWTGAQEVRICPGCGRAFTTTRTSKKRVCDRSGPCHMRLSRRKDKRQR